MDIEKLIKRLRTESLYADKASLEIMDLCMEAATALSTLHGENEKLRAEKEYIERAAVHELVKRIPRYEMFNYDRTESLTGINPDDVDFGVDKIPAAPVVEVRHGRWLKRSYGTPYCSNCGANERDTYSSVVNECAFCYSCGARMDKEDGHEVS